MVINPEELKRLDPRERITRLRALKEKNAQEVQEAEKLIDESEAQIKDAEKQILEQLEQEQQRQRHREHLPSLDALFEEEIPKRKVIPESDDEGSYEPQKMRGHVAEQEEAMYRASGASERGSHDDRPTTDQLYEKKRDHYESNVGEARASVTSLEVMDKIQKKYKGR
ncbi:hypothetical protein J4460_02235 [Candidatus Woesearchaeota archaeon]|nr:MAG: hypothetical protein QS99_C0004G0013 [archaeon GW2011_AR4]MBS3129471.1 hypothetical protein [Candidatus Woesearchaeota archaeon]HIH38909.1 hypothetical protein [Candidatus Woesearchaeota archaeon]HIH49679.1 hypothetical protein [Candidatus Woesearchaeota archaeon]HIJ03758.1 hypothetical protein [Candidatus Woesearchaeota archaeon]